MIGIGGNTWKPEKSKKVIELLGHVLNLAADA
jgi:hypothetical protein